MIQSADRLIIYQEGADYLIGSFGEFTEIIIPLGSALGPDDTVLVTYQAEVDPSIKYVNKTHFVGTSVVLWRNRLTLYGRLLRAEQDILSGGGGLDQFGSVDHYTLGGKVKTEQYSYGIELRQAERDVSRETNLGMHVSYSRHLRGVSTYSNTHFEYNRYKAISTDSSYRLSNRTGFKKQISSKVNFKSEGMYRLRSGRGDDRHELSALLGLNTRIGQTRIGFAFNDEWVFTGGETTHSDMIEMTLRRYF
jgi:hypothetical protein